MSTIAGHNLGPLYNAIQVLIDEGGLNVHAPNVQIALQDIADELVRPPPFNPLEDAPDPQERISELEETITDLQVSLCAADEYIEELERRLANAGGAVA